MNSSPSLKKGLSASIKKQAVDGKITCTVLRRVAEKAGVTYKEAGRAADKLKIKIRNCDLGCF